MRAIIVSLCMSCSVAPLVAAQPPHYRSLDPGDLLVSPKTPYAPIRALVEPLLGPGEVVAWASSLDGDRRAGPLKTRRRQDFINHAVLSANLAIQPVTPGLWYIHPNKPALVQGLDVAGSHAAPVILVPGDLKPALAWFASHYGYSLLWDAALDVRKPKLSEMFEASGESLPVDLKRLQMAVRSVPPYVQLHNDDRTRTIYANSIMKGFAYGEHLNYVDDYDLF